jgi:hypothetical protein
MVGRCVFCQRFFVFGNPTLKFPKRLATNNPEQAKKMLSHFNFDEDTISKIISDVASGIEVRFCLGHVGDDSKEAWRTGAFQYDQSRDSWANVSGFDSRPPTCDCACFWCGSPQRAARFDANPYLRDLSRSDQFKALFSITGNSSTNWVNEHLSLDTRIRLHYCHLDPIDGVSEPTKEELLAHWVSNKCILNKNKDPTYYQVLLLN